jgi:uncharacterized membrane protein YjgN (DUF898 family)
MFCQTCGGEVPEQARFCGACGAPLATDAARHPDFRADGGAFFLLFLKNVLLTVLTLGIYSAWAKTRVRQYLWSHFGLDGEFFSYHGTGMELLISRLKLLAAGAVAILALVAAVFALQSAGIPPEKASPVIALGVYATIALLVPFAMVGAARYRLSRTSYRGVRFSFRGEYGALLGIFVKGVLLSVLTLGIYSPVFLVNIFAFFARNTFYGNEAFAFEGDGQELIVPYLIALVLALPTLGISFFWFNAARTRYCWSRLRTGSLRLRSEVQGGGLFGLTVGNILLMIVTLGIAYPWTVLRNIRFFADHLSVSGDLNWEAIRQEARPATAFGEGLADALDLDVGL